MRCPKYEVTNERPLSMCVQPVDTLNDVVGWSKSYTIIMHQFQSDNFSTSRSAKLVFIEFLINVTGTISAHSTE